MNKVVELEVDDSVGDHEIVLRLLDAVDRDPNVTQRRIADDFGVALGLVNAYLKRCVKKGLIKIGEVPARRYAYYLTPHGFSEKARLTRTYLTHSFTFFRNARLECGTLLAECARRGMTRVALAGRGDLAEIVVLCAADSPVELVGVVDGGALPGETLLKLPVVGDFDELDVFDAVLVCDLDHPQEVYDSAIRRFPAERVLAPKLLCLVTRAPGAAR
ncbi:MAG: winged helix-turn-helix transcriptional regulator [Magnetospirillum sp.]|nr:winged helix-turn-helix transcriptional regulator [Magnetospirillum sp.]